MSTDEGEEKKEIEEEEVPAEAKEEPEAGERGSLQPRVEVKPPRELEEADVLTPLVDIYLQERGLADRNQAVHKLVSALNQIGYKVPREVRNVGEYVAQIRSILNSLPDTDESLPVKGAIASDAALTSSKILKRRYLGGDDMEDLVRLATRMGIIFKAMDHAFQGRTSQPQQIPEELRKRLASLESEIRALREEKKRREIEELIAARLEPVKKSIDELKEALKEFSKRPTSEGESEVVKAIESLKETLTKSEIKELAEKIDSLPEKIGEGTGGKSALETVRDVLSSLAQIKSDLERVTGKPATTPSETPDWKTVAIQQIGDILRETLPRLSSGGEEKKGEELSLQDVIDQKVLEYAINAQIYGDGVLYWDKCAKALGLTPEQVYASVQRLINKGVLRGAKFIRPETEKETETEKAEGKPEERRAGEVEEEKKGGKRKRKAEWESYT